MFTNSLRYAEGLQPNYLLQSQDIVATATASQYLDLDQAHWVTFVIPFGSLTSDSTDTCTVTVEASTAGSSNATEQKIGFQYRLSSAVATGSIGAITSATTDGVAITAADDNKLLIIDLDPSAVAALGDDFQFVRVVATPNAEMAACNLSVIAFVEHRYPGNASPSST